MQQIKAIKSRLYKRSFLLSSIILLLMAGIFVIMAIHTYQRTHVLESMLFSTYIILFSTLSFSVFTWRLFKRVPEISIDEEKIVFGKRTCNREDIEQIILFNNVPQRIYNSARQEVTTITLNDGKPIHIPDDYINNSAEIKSFLDTHYLNGAWIKNYQQNLSGRPTGILKETETFKGNPFFTTLFLIPFTMGLLFSTTMFTAPGNLFSITLPILTGLLILTVILFYNRVNYFTIINTHLLVHNRIFNNKETTFNLNDIAEISFVSNDYYYTTIRIITKDYKNHHFKTCSLSNKAISKFQNTIKSLGIVVRNHQRAYIYK